MTKKITSYLLMLVLAFLVSPLALAQAETIPTKIAQLKGTWVGTYSAIDKQQNMDHGTATMIVTDEKKNFFWGTLQWKSNVTASSDISPALKARGITKILAVISPQRKNIHIAETPTHGYMAAYLLNAQTFVFSYL